jgi:hypothetical protein
MKNWISRFVCLAGCLLLAAQILPGQTNDPAKIAELTQRFQSGVKFVNDGKPQEALDVFLGIIKEEPKARGSLFYAAVISLQLGQADAADGYISRFRELAPTDFRGLIVMIQVNQALRRSVKVEALRKELLTLRGSSNIPGLTDARSYTRERINGDKGTFVNIAEFFDYTVEPNFVYLAEELNPDGELQRRLTVFYNKDETAKARAQDPKFASVEVFNFSEDVLKDGKPVQVNIYRQEVDKPSYETARKWILDALHEPPKPLVTVPLPPMEEPPRATP